MTEYDALTAAVLADPGDDAPRLVFADWFEDHGQPARAEFIRLQCRLALPDSPSHPQIVREIELLHDHHDEWAGPLPDLLGVRGVDPSPNRTLPTWRFERGFVGRVGLPCAAFVRNAAALFRAHPVTRIDLIDRRPTYWRNGVYVENRWAFGEVTDTDPHFVPWELGPFFRGGTPGPHGSSRNYSVESQAWADLHDACIRYGREVAGLPELVVRRDGTA